MIRHLWPILCLSVAATAAAAESDSDVPPAPAAAEVVRELNLARSNPKAYASQLKAWLPYFEGAVLRLPGRPGLLTREGRAAVEEAIDVLERQPPVPSQSRQPELDRAAQDHVGDQAKSGAMGHTGSDGSAPADRMRRYGKLGGLAAENITYGPDTARDIVLQLLVDDGVPSRGHRTNLLQPRLALVGVAIGRHPSGRWMCVMDYAERLTRVPAVGESDGQPQPER